MFSLSILYSASYSVCTQELTSDWTVVCSSELFISYHFCSQSVSLFSANTTIKKSKSSGDQYSPYFRDFSSCHLSYTINYCESLSYFLPLYNRMTSQPHTISQHVTLREYQSHFHWYQNVEYSHFYHRIKFERNWFITLQTQASLNHILYKVTEFSPLSTDCAKQTNKKVQVWTHEHIEHAYYSGSQSAMKFARKCAHKFLLSHAPMTLNKGQGHSNWYQTMHLSGVYHQTKFEINQFVDVGMHTNI